MANPRDQAIARAGQIAARAWAELAVAYAEGGPEAVAALPHEPGTDRERIAELYESWVREERGRHGRNRGRERR